MEVRQLTLGSLFSGLGGFELAGSLCGVKPIWCSEIEPFVVKVEAARFPQCKQIGSVTDINGAQIEPVDIITFGSPCQDLSVAGKQLGIHEGQRSNLFFEAVRIITEMREATHGVYPRFAVWENVPGAFSSNKGRDFQAVLQAFCDIWGGRDHIVPMPPHEKWLPAGCVVGDGASLAWRVYDAQYWGVPQRRKRIYLIADFGSERAGEILFKPESVRWDTAQSGEAREGTAADAQGSAGRSDLACQVNYPAAFMGGQGAKARSIAYCEDGSTPTLKSSPSGGNTVPDVVYPINTMVATRGGKDDMRTCFGVGEPNDPQFTISAAHEHAVAFQLAGDRNNPSVSTSEKAYCIPANPMSDRGQAVCFRKSSKPGTDGKGEKWVEDETSNTLNGFEFHSDVRTPEVVCYPDKARSLCARADSSPCIDRGQNVVCVQNTGRGWWNEGEVAETLRTPCGGDSTKANLVVHALDCRNMEDNVEVSGTIQAKNEGGHSLNFINPVVYRQDGFAGYSEGVGTLKASGGDMGGCGKHRR